MAAPAAALPPTMAVDFFLVRRLSTTLRVVAKLSIRKAVVRSPYFEPHIMMVRPGLAALVSVIRPPLASCATAHPVAAPFKVFSGRRRGRQDRRDLRGKNVVNRRLPTRPVDADCHCDSTRALWEAQERRWTARSVELLARFDPWMMKRTGRDAVVSGTRRRIAVVILDLGDRWLLCEQPDHTNASASLPPGISPIIAQAPRTSEYCISQSRSPRTIVRVTDNLNDIIEVGALLNPPALKSI